MRKLEGQVAIKVTVFYFTVKAVL